MVSTPLEQFVYEELRRVAATYMRKERPNHTLQVTGLVHEAMTRIMQAPYEFANEKHFYVVAAAIMRHILVDYAKARNASKRNGGLQIELNEGNHASTDGGIDLIELSEALEKLEEHSETAADALDLRYFGGMTVPEIARLLGLSEASVFRELRFGKAWLLAQLQDTKDSDCDRDTD